MPLTINPIGSTLYTPRPLQRVDDAVTPLGQQSAINNTDPTSTQRLNDRLQIAQDNAEQAAQEREARLEEQQQAAAERRQALQEQQAELAQRNAELTQQTIEDQLRQQQVQRSLESQQLDQTDNVTQNNTLAQQNAAQQQLEANQLTFGQNQAAVGPRVAAQAITTYQETQSPTFVGQSLVA